MHRFADNTSMELVDRTCQACSGRMEYKGSGVYVCEECGNEFVTDFGKVKRYLEENGPSNAVVLSRETGVSRRTISDFLKSGRIEVVENSETYNFCLRCGVAIRSGTLCAACAKKQATESKKSGSYNVLADDSQQQKGEMRFVNSEKK